MARRKPFTINRIYYTTEAHRYTEDAPCADPDNCPKRSHWLDSGEKYSTFEEARAAIEDDDAPAVFIFEVKQELVGHRA